MSSVEIQEKVLIIEDIDSITKLFAILLKKASLESLSFDNGEDACTWLIGNKPKLILCDIMLPGMSGESVLEHLRSLDHGKDTIIIAVTALAMEGDKERLLEKGFNDYIAKPINAATFITQIMKYL